MARRNGIETIAFSDHEDISDALRELTDGRRPDATIDAVGMEAHGTGAPLAELAQKAARAVRRPRCEGDRKAAVDRLTALLSCIDSVRRGGTVSISDVYGGQRDPLPMMQIFDKGL
jgi:threonine dehydrogenase-like Zn-dependent dehydrogenase